MFNILRASKFACTTACIILGVLVVDAKFIPLEYTALYLGCFVIAVYTCWTNYTRLRQISNVPISTIAAAAQGYIELHGRASTTESLKTPYLGIPCVWYRSSAYDDRNEAHSNEHNKGLLELLVSDHIFQLKDRSGICLVNPKGAEMRHVHKKTGRRHNHKYVEEYIPANSLVYMIGYLDTRHDYLVPKRINQDVNKKLAEWKNKPATLLAKYDRDRNGELSLHEWEKARQEARKLVVAEHKRKASNNTYMLAKPKNKQLFLISALSPEDLRTSFLWCSIVHLSLALVMLYKLSL